MKTINNTRIIGIDHGFGNMKTANCCFPTGVIAYDCNPTFTRDMLVYDGKYYLSYGLHTARLFKREETTDPAQMDYYRKNGKMGVFRFDEIPGVPMGATYAVSDDGGMTFRKSNVLFHTAQNPTVFNRPDGKLELVSHFGVKPGFFLSDHLGDWTLYDDNPPTTGDCPCLFAWHGWTYIVQGFNQFAASREDGKPGTWQETVSQGWDVYDGLAVPMVSPFAGDRRIMAGWIRSPRGWGGWLCLRELVYHADGTLGVAHRRCAPAPVRSRRHIAANHLRAVMRQHLLHAFGHLLVKLERLGRRTSPDLRHRFRTRPARQQIGAGTIRHQPSYVAGSESGKKILRGGKRIGRHQERTRSSRNDIRIRLVRTDTVYAPQRANQKLFVHGHTSFSFRSAKRISTGSSPCGSPSNSTASASAAVMRTGSRNTRNSPHGLPR